MSTSMVEGSPLKLMLRFAMPLLAGNLLQQTYNIIDAAIVGQTLGAQALAGVGASSSVQFLVLGFCMGSCAGFGVPIAKYFGAGDQKKMRDCVFNGAALTALIAVILTITCSLLCNSILHILSVPSDIYADAYRYLIVIFLGIPFTLMYNYLSSILRSVGDSRTPFLFLAFSAGLNIFLDLFCIIVLHWGCMGAAIATVTAQAVSAVLCLLFIKKKMPLLWLEKENRIMQRNTSAELLKMGLPTGFQFSITAIGTIIVQGAVNAFGASLPTMDWAVFVYRVLQQVCGSNNLPCARLMHSVQQLLYFAARIWELERLTGLKKDSGKESVSQFCMDCLQV